MSPGRRLRSLAAHLRQQEAGVASSVPVAAGAGGGVAPEVPVVDLAEVIAAPGVGSLSASAAAIAAIRRACSTWGFFQVVNHGVPETQVREFEETMAAFFAQPRAVKEGVRRTEGNSKGWYDDELTKQRVDWKQGFDVGAQEGSLDLPGLDGENQWPAAPSNFEAVVRRWFGAMEALSARLAGCMALGLGLAATHFAPEFEGCHSSYLRLNYYPPAPQLPEETSRARASVWEHSLGREGEPPVLDPWAISHHTDAGALTVLHQSQVQSLQVYRPSRANAAGERAFPHCVRPS
jgi:isopenicillin N synthase-like dioxygenase